VTSGAWSHVAWPKHISVVAAVIFTIAVATPHTSGVSRPSPQGDEIAWTYADTAFEWSFPRDHWAHAGYKTEWWYFTGQLADVTDSTKRFGYQFTFFRVGVVPDSLTMNSAWAVTDLVMGHAAITDITTGEHRFSELVYRANGFLGAFPPAGDSLVVWSRAPTGTDELWKLSWEGGGFSFRAMDDRAGIALDLETRQTKPLLFQGPNGYSRKGEGPTAASLYYTLPRLATTGTVLVDGEEFTVSGESWMDKEFGSNQLAEDQVGWDWFSLRLEDGRDIMLYLLRDGDGDVDFARATLNTRQGAARYLSGDEFQIEALDTWRSQETGAEYPISWRLEIPAEGLSFTVVAEVPDQENVSRLVPNLFYWEGSVRITGIDGVRLGQGYVELTGYGSAVPLGI
jgi:predicted secreted hydrolase